MPSVAERRRQRILANAEKRMKIVSGDFVANDEDTQTVEVKKTVVEETSTATIEKPGVENIDTPEIVEEVKKPVAVEEKLLDEIVEEFFVEEKSKEVDSDDKKQITEETKVIDSKKHKKRRVQARKMVQVTEITAAEIKEAETSKQEIENVKDEILSNSSKTETSNPRLRRRIKKAVTTEKEEEEDFKVDEEDTKKSAAVIPKANIPTVPFTRKILLILSSEVIIRSLLILFLGIFVGIKIVNQWSCPSYQEDSEKLEVRSVLSDFLNKEQPSKTIESDSITTDFDDEFLEKETYTFSDQSAEMGFSLPFSARLSLNFHGFIPLNSYSIVLPPIFLIAVLNFFLGCFITLITTGSISNAVAKIGSVGSSSGGGMLMTAVSALGFGKILKVYGLVQSIVMDYLWFLFSLSWTVAIYDTMKVYTECS